MRQDLLVQLRAPLHEELVLGEQRVHVEVLGRRERRRVEPLGLLVDLAVDRGRALAHAARIECDQVEPVVHGAEQLDADVLRGGDGVATRPAVVDEQRADAMCLVLSGKTRDGDLREAPARMAVIEWGLVSRALPARGCGIGVGAGPPLEPGRRRRLGHRRSDRQQCGDHCQRGDERSRYRSTTHVHVPLLVVAARCHLRTAVSAGYARYTQPKRVCIPRGANSRKMQQPAEAGRYRAANCRGAAAPRQPCVSRRPR